MIVAAAKGREFGIAYYLPMLSTVAFSLLWTDR